MILRGGEAFQTLPEAVDPTLCKLLLWTADPITTPGAYRIAMAQVSREEIEKMPPKARDIWGIPTIFAVTMRDAVYDRLLLHPVPERDFVADFYYHPPMKRI